ncbi:MAG TPA: hypothetical protein VLK33_06075, partial [Terriglobales bacterium]|nr:hypothetical protein [Terriglobales bacterium]
RTKAGGRNCSFGGCAMSRQIVEEVLSKRDAKELWAIGYRPALPITPQDFTLGGVLPAVMYMMRWGQRRGRGKFFDTFGKDATVAIIAQHLADDKEHFEGFDGRAEQGVLADLMLAFCLENKGHKVGRHESVQRVFPTHYFSSWADLPKEGAHLRFVPEMIVALLGNQEKGAYLKQNGSGYYAIASGFESNLLLSLFGIGTSTQKEQHSLNADVFDENVELGIDQILAVRLAQTLGEAPIKLRGDNPEIPNQIPVATRAAKTFFEDFNVFLRSYGKSTPRQSLLLMLESCIAIGTLNIFLSTLNITLEWANTGSVTDKDKQKPWALFVDCSSSTDNVLRRYSEESVDDLVQRLSRMPVCMMCMRVLEQRARQEKIEDIPEPYPDPTAHINFLGDLLLGRHEESGTIKAFIRSSCNKLADALDEAGEVHAKTLLENKNVHPAWRMAEALVYLMGDKLHGAHFRKFLDSCLMIDQPHGLGRKRRAFLKSKSVERRSIVLTNTVLDFLVHRHLRKAKRGTGASDLSLNGFIRILRERYGFYVDESPPGLSIPSDQLSKNRNYLERRLRDLGLFVGVNDAEAMKRLRPRFKVDNDNDD